MISRLKTLFPLLLLVSPLTAQDPEPLSCEEAYRVAMESKSMSESDKQLARFDYRICGQKERHELENFNVADGIDAFEAWYLATRFRIDTYGDCGRCNVPTRNGPIWEIRFAHGAVPIEGPLITIDAATGVVRCEGHPDLTDSMAMIRATLAELEAENSLTAEQRLQLMRKEAAEREAAIADALRQQSAERPLFP